MKTLREIQVEQAEWSKANFGEHSVVDPAIGVIEEVGELARSILKARQGIRGTAKEWVVKRRDAIGDIAIYELDVCTSCRVEVDESYEPYGLDFTVGGLLGALAFEAGDQLGNITEGRLYLVKRNSEEIFELLADVASIYGWDLLEIVNEVWKMVKRRDWKANPETGADDLPTHVSGVPVHLRDSAESILGSKVDWSTGRVLGASPDEDDWTNQPTANVGVSCG